MNGISSTKRKKNIHRWQIIWSFLSAQRTNIWVSGLIIYLLNLCIFSNEINLEPWNESHSCGWVVVVFTTAILFCLFNFETLGSIYYLFFILLARCIYCLILHQGRSFWTLGRGDNQHPELNYALSFQEMT